MWNFSSLPGWVSLVCQGFCFLCSELSCWKINVEIKSWTQINQHRGAVKDSKPKPYLNIHHHISFHRSEDLLKQHCFLTSPICTSSEKGQSRSQPDTGELQLKWRTTNHKVKQPPHLNLSSRWQHSPSLGKERQDCTAPQSIYTANSRANCCQQDFTPYVHRQLMCKTHFLQFLWKHSVPFVLFSF